MFGDTLILTGLDKLEEPPSLGLFAQRPKKVHFTGCMVFNYLIGICLGA
jgi:hypothetical protein